MRWTVLVLLYLAYCMVQAVRVGNDPIGRKLSPVCVPSLVASELAQGGQSHTYLSVTFHLQLPERIIIVESSADGGTAEPVGSA